MLRNEITGVVLAGGRGSRMGGVDKGLLRFHGVPMVAYALAALESVAGTLLINANRHHEEYRRFGVPVIADAAYEGPLAGLLSALRTAQTSYVLSVPCDSPLVTASLLTRLCSRLGETGAEVCAAHDGERLHPVFLLAERRLADHLQRYLASGQRKLQSWLSQHRLTLADFADHPELFANINTPEDLTALEAAHPALFPPSPSLPLR